MFDLFSMFDGGPQGGLVEFDSRVKVMDSDCNVVYFGEKHP